MAGHFRVEPASLRQAAASLGQLAGEVATADVSGPLDRATAAVPGSAVGRQAARLSGEAAARLDTLVEAVREMSAAHTSAAGSYTRTDTGNAGVLNRLSSGLGRLAP